MIKEIKLTLPDIAAKSLVVPIEDMLLVSLNNRLNSDINVNTPSSEVANESLVVPIEASILDKYCLCYCYPHQYLTIF